MKEERFSMKFERQAYRLQGLYYHPKTEEGHGQVVNCDKFGDIDWLKWNHQPSPNWNQYQICNGKLFRSSRSNYSPIHGFIVLWDFCAFSSHALSTGVRTSNLGRDFGLSDLHGWIKPFRAKSWLPSQLNRKKFGWKSNPVLFWETE